MVAEDWYFLESDKSEYFIYTASNAAKETFFYPIQCGYFSYKKGYHLKRDKFDSYLLLYVTKGCMNLVLDGVDTAVAEGAFMLVDCYRLHEYYTTAPCECIWLHYDGIVARPYFNKVKERLGNVITLANPYAAYTKLNTIYQTFSKKEVLQEAVFSKQITDILTLFLTAEPASSSINNTHTEMGEEMISYINEHFAEDLTIGMLAEKAGLSHFHFIRSFKKATGYTPHEYIINCRMQNARFLLRYTSLPVKDICFSTGFASESVFCSSFKRNTNMTPAQYRQTCEG